MKKRKISTIFLALATVFLFSAQSAWAYTEVTPAAASAAVSAGNGVIIDVRSVDEHNGCNAAWDGFACPTVEAENRGAPAWVDGATGVVMQSANIPWWIDIIGSLTSPQDSTEFQNSFQSLLDSGYMNTSTPVYLICRSGGRSAGAAAWIEANMGFSNVYNITGGMLEWTASNLLVPWDSSINRGWKAPQLFSISPAYGYTETATSTVTFNFGILEPTWGTLSYGDIVKLSLYVDGFEVDSSTIDITNGSLLTTSSFTVDLADGVHTWNIRAEALVLTPGGANIVGFNRLADNLGPGDRLLTMDVGVVVVCTDDDGDGYAIEGGACGAVDCDDSNASVNPGAVEGPLGDPTCSDTLDNDCDGTVDAADLGCQTIFICTDNDGDGYAVEGGDCGDIDCNDSNAAINPGATEVCDGVDNDCDGSVDEGFDADGDGYTTCGGDCDDTNPAINLGATEGPAGDATCSDGLDNDCDGAIDDADSGCVVDDGDIRLPRRNRRGGGRGR